jgi:tRNA(Ile)-lysidine synthase
MPEEKISRAELLSAIKAATARVAHSGKPMVLGVSGGVDSMALLHLACEALGRERSLLRVVHCNHGLRGVAAQKDALLVGTAAKALGLSFRLVALPVRRYAAAAKCSLETAGRILRYRAFALLAQEWGAESLLLAHHQADQVETVLGNLIRGSGLAGLAGMSGSRRHWDYDIHYGFTVLRPLLAFPKSALLEYCQARHVIWREDRSNRDARYRRNYLRQRLIPEIERALNPQFVRQFAGLIAIAQGENAWWENETKRLLSGLIEMELLGYFQLRRAEWLALHQAWQRRVMLGVWRKAGIPSPGFEAIERALAQIAFSNRGLDLPGGWRMETSAKQVVFLQRETLWPSRGFHFALKDVQEVNSIGPFGVETRLCGFSPGTLKDKKPEECYLSQRFFHCDNAVLRSAKSEDTMAPLGSPSARRPIHKILSDLKIPLCLRAHWPVLEHSGVIAWVYRGPIGRDFQVATYEKRAWHIRLSLKNQESLQAESEA